MPIDPYLLARSVLGPTAQAEVARRARHLAQASSPKALGELRDLVRGIHPSVLAYRGLVDACAPWRSISPLRWRCQRR